MQNYLENNHEKLTFKNFNDVDAAYLAMLSLLDVSLFPKDDKAISLKEAIDNQVKKHGVTKLGLILSENITKTIIKGINSGRYINLYLHDCFSLISKEKNTQSNIFQLDLNDEITFIIFGSTDDSLVGWKENCLLTYTTKIPCLEYCLDYIENRLDKNKKYIFIGHSKGGMESIYCGLANNLKEENIIKIYDFDGPGFKKETVEKLQKSPLINKCVFYTPYESVVGRILSPVVKPIIVKSSEHGLLQHDLSSWVVEKDHFVILDKYKEELFSISDRVNNFILTSDDKKIENIVADIFKVLYNENCETLTDLSHNILSANKVYLTLPLESKRSIFALIQYLINEKLLPEFIKEKYIIKED